MANFFRLLLCTACLLNGSLLAETKSISSIQTEEAEEAPTDLFGRVDAYCSQDSKMKIRIGGPVLGVLFAAMLPLSVIGVGILAVFTGAAVLAWFKCMVNMAACAFS